ncbi:hypothetical protein, partial [Nostoc sp.]|uniref:hypothetical protein n=1 Tax=Nostoc sp. TaxID=1180 RepID=UPI002FF74919
MKKCYKLAITVAVVGFGLGTLNVAQAATFTVNASDQGWWAVEHGYGQNNGRNDNDNTNYITGYLRGLDFRNFFTFDLGAIAGVSSATLQIQRFEGAVDPTETLGFFDVSTPAADFFWVLYEKTQDLGIQSEDKLDAVSNGNKRT